MPRLGSSRVVQPMGSWTVAVLILMVSAASAAETSRVDAFSGTVRDTLGNLIEGAEVLVVDRVDALDPIASGRSNADGQFRFPGLPPGAYRIAAVKDGYLAFVGRIDTGLKQILDVVLHPLPLDPNDLPNAIPADSSWSYRVPRRHVLNEVDDPLRFVDEGPTDPVAVVTESMRMEFEQLFALGGAPGPREDVGPRPESQGSETRVHLASALGRRGAIEVQGLRQSLGATRTDSVEQATASRESTAVKFSLSYDATPDSQLAMTAFYGQRDQEFGRELLQIDSAALALPDLGGHAQSYWGYETSWTRQLDPASSLELQLDYHDTRLTIPDKGAFVDVDSPQPAQSVQSRAVGAAGTYASVPAADHQVEVGFRAQLLEAPDPTMRAIGGDFSNGFRGISGLSLGLDARDTWTVSGPFSVTYGLGYRHAVNSDDTSLIVPRLGGAMRLDGLSLRVLFSYHGVARWGTDMEGEASLAEPQSFRPATALGYEVEFDIPMGRRLRLSGATSYSPIELERLGYTHGAGGGSQPIYLTDGNVAVRENRMAVVQDSSGARTYVEVSHGTVDGTVAAIFPDELPLQVLADRAIRYGTGRFGVRIIPSGTDLQLEFQRIRQSAHLDLDSAEARQRSLEFRLMQDLMDMHALGNWRLLMAVRMASVRGEEPAENSPYATDALLVESLNHRFSAGLSVVF